MNIEDGVGVGIGIFIFIAITMYMAGHYVEDPKETKDQVPFREFTISDGTRCVEVFGTGLSCDWKKK